MSGSFLRDNAWRFGILGTNIAGALTSRHVELRVFCGTVAVLYAFHVHHLFKLSRKAAP